jgi:hypothetical protein
MYLGVYQKQYYEILHFDFLYLYDSLNLKFTGSLVKLIV